MPLFTSYTPLPDIAHAHSKYLKPTGATYEVYDRATCYSQNTAILSSGRLQLVCIALPAGVTVTNISFKSATTPLSAGSNQWFALFDANRNKLGVTSDDTSNAWSANVIKTLALTTPYTTPTAGLYYLGVCVVATVPSMETSLITATLSGLPPILTGTADTGLTNPASCPTTATTIGATANLPYAYVS